eukprot:12096572-Alexandrium_andersonii.AAC.1
MAMPADVLQRGFTVDMNNVLSIATYVDNIYAVSDSATDAVALLGSFECLLCSRWRQHFKPSSRSVMVPRGSELPLPDGVSWPSVRQFLCLGHIISDNGGICEA